MHIWVWEYVWCGGSLISHGPLDNNCQGGGGSGAGKVGFLNLRES